MKRQWFILLLMLVIIVGCSNNQLQKININDILSGQLYIHKSGELVKEIEWKKDDKRLNEAVDLYNGSQFISVEEDENGSEVDIDPISTDGSLEETYSASYFEIQLNGDTYYIGYKGKDIFKVIASGDSFNEQPKEFFIKNKELKKWMGKIGR